MTLVQAMCKSYVTRGIHGVQFLRAAAASSEFFKAVALGAFARCRYQSEEGDLRVSLEQHFGVSLVFCGLDRYVAADVRVELTGKGLEAKLALAPQTWGVIAASGAVHKKVVPYDPARMYKPPFHTAPGKAQEERGRPFQAGGDFFVDLQDNVTRLAGGQPPTGAKAPPLKRKDFEAEKPVLNRTNVVGRFKDMSTNVPVTKAEHFLQYLQDLPRLRCKLVLVLLAIATRVWEEEGGCNVVGHAAFFANIFMRVETFLKTKGQAPVKRSKRIETRRSDIMWSLTAAPSLAKSPGLQGRDVSRAIGWTRLSRRPARAATRPSCARRAIPLTVKTTRCSFRDGLHGWCSCHGGQSACLQGTIEMLMQLLQTGNRRGVIELFDLTKAAKDSKKLESDVAAEAGERDDDEEDEHFVPDGAEDNDDDEDDGGGGNDEVAVEEEKAAREVEEASYKEATRRLNHILARVNERLEPIGVRAVRTVAEFFELFAPANTKKATEDASLLFGALVDFVVQVRQLLPEKTWSWMPQMRRQWHWSFSNTWLRHMFTTKKGAAQWAGWFGPNVATLWKIVLPQLPFVRRNTDGMFRPLDPGHVIHVMEKFHAGPSSVITDGCTVRVSGSKLWKTMRMSPTANNERLLQLKAALLAQAWSGRSRSC